LHVIAWVSDALEVCAFQLDKPVLEVVRLEDVDVERDHLGELGGLVGGDVAGYGSGCKPGHGIDRVGGLLQVSSQVNSYTQYSAFAAMTEGVPAITAMTVTSRLRARRNRPCRRAAEQ
jgi:hypothetical protein